MPVNWRVLVLYAVLMALMQFEWLRFAPITTLVAEHYDVPPSAVGDFALVFPLLCVILALPVGALLDYLTVRTSLRIIAVGMAIAAILRLPALTEGYSYVMAGQIVFSLLQPMVLGWSRNYLMCGSKRKDAYKLPRYPAWRCSWA